jgi:hypothetical protein
MSAPPRNGIAKCITEDQLCRTVAVVPDCDGRREMGNSNFTGTLQQGVQHRQVQDLSLGARSNATPAFISANEVRIQASRVRSHANCVRCTARSTRGSASRSACSRTMSVMAIHLTRSSVVRNQFGNSAQASLELGSWATVVRKLHVPILCADRKERSFDSSVAVATFSLRTS